MSDVDPTAGITGPAASGEANQARATGAVSPAPGQPTLAVDRPRKHRLPPAIRAMRPRQWVKNVLVFAAPMAAGRIFEPDVFLRTVLATVGFILVSAAVYLMNDSRDVAEDRLHPKKRFRPIAAGELSIPAALILAAVCTVIALVLGFWLSIALGATLAIYVGLQVAYSAFLKNRPVIDLAMVASGFVLRAIAGGVASHLALSQWFLLVAAFGSLFMVGGKRYSELVSLGAEARTRKSLRAYRPSYLRFVWESSCALVIMSYSLWAFEQHRQSPSDSPVIVGLAQVPWAQISIVPFVLALLRYAMRIDDNRAGEPEDVVLGDRTLQVFGLIFVVIVALAVLL